MGFFKQTQGRYKYFLLYNKYITNFLVHNNYILKKKIIQLVEQKVVEKKVNYTFCLKYSIY